MPETVDPATTAFGAFLERPDVPFRRHHPEPVEHVAAARRRGVGPQRQRQLGRAGERGHVLRAAEHAEPGRIGDDQRHAAADDLCSSTATCSASARRCRCGPDVVSAVAAAAGPVPVLQRRPRLRQGLREPAHLSRSTRPTSRSSRRTVSGYVDFIWNEGRHLTRFLNYNRSGPSCCDQGPGHGQHLRLQRHAVGAAARRGDGDQQPRRTRATAA